VNRRKAPDDDQPAEVDQAGRWKCDLCKWQNDEVEPICRGCLRGFQPELLPPQRHFLAVLQPTGATAELRTMHVSGATDAEILALVAEKLPPDGQAMTEEEPVSWTCMKSPAGDILIAIWFGSLSAVNNDPGKRPDWIAADVVKELREAFRIPNKFAAAVPAKNGKASKSERPSLAKAAAETTVATQLRIPVDRIFAKNNPRETFNKEGLERLAESIRQNDVIEPLVVRPADANGRYELLAGERRLRAAKLAKLKDVPVVVRDCDEAQAAKIRLIENFVREDLNALEEAKAFQQITAAGVTQQELADELQLTQSHISNRIRLLELPDDWQQRLITHEISASQARSLVPWATRPLVLKGVARSLKERRKWNDDPPSTADFDRFIINAFRENSRPMKPRWSGDGEPFTPTAEELEQLDVVELKLDRDKEARAFNLELWEQIQKRVKAKKAERESKKAEREDAKTAKLSPAEQKRKADEARQKLDAKVFQWRTRWYQDRIAANLSTATLHQTYRCLLFFAIGDTHNQRATELTNVVTSFGGSTPKKSRGYYQSPDVWSALKDLDDAKLPDLVTSTLAEWWRHDADRWGSDVSAHEVEAFAGELGIGLKKDWRVDRGFLELFTKEQLGDLAGEWTITANKTWLAGKKEKRTDLIDTLLAVDEKKRLPAPACLINAKGR